MRNLLYFMILFILLAWNIQSYAQDNQPTDDQKMVEVIGWFSKQDTAIYSLHETKWRINGTDTAQVGNVMLKVRVVVTDSTSNGYDMEYTFLDVQQESDDDNPYAAIQNMVVESFGKSMIGTTVKFKTTDCGAITEISNLSQIKKRVKSAFNEAIKNLMNMPQMQPLKASGVKLENVAKLVDTDQLVDDCISELKLIFTFHGHAYKSGLKHDHEDASETSYENDTYITAVTDPDDDTYSVSVEIVNIIPHESLSDIIEEVIKSIANKKTAEQFLTDVNNNTEYSGAKTSYMSSQFLSSGWPYRVVLQEGTYVGDFGKISQKYIILESIK